MNISTKFTDRIRTLAPYKPVYGTQKFLKLDASENDFIQPQLGMATNYYPDSKATELVNALAIYTGIKASMITVGNGSDELIDLLCALFLDAGDVLIDCPPTFPMYQHFARVRGAQIEQVPRLDDYSLDIPNITRVSQRSKLIFIANPNNPTGTLTNRTQLLKLLKTNIPVVIDEAYFEYSQESVQDWLQKYSNLIIIRTFSKWAGLAGVRIGYLLADTKVVNAINTIKPPYNTNVFAQALATKALDDSKLQVAVNKQIKIRDWFISQLQNLNVGRVLDSKTNFVCIKLNSNQAKKIGTALNTNSIKVKRIDSDDFSGIRIGLSSKTNLKKVLSIIEEAL